MTGPTRPFRFACRTRSSRGPLNARAWSDVARGAEDLGFDVLVVADHARTGQAPLPALAYTAAITDRVRLGLEVLNNDFRHPAILAKELATVDVLSEGRLEIGLGCGYRQEDYDTTGIPFLSLRRRVDRLAESVTVLKELLGTRSPVDYNGSYYKVDSLLGLPVPVQKPCPPLAIGGRSRRLLTLAAQEADTYSITAGADPRGWSLEQLTELAERALTIAQECGNDLELHMLPKGCYAGPDAESFLAGYASRKGIAPEALQASAHALIGSPTQIAEHLCMLYEQAHISYVTIPSDCMTAFAPIMETVRDNISGPLRRTGKV